MVKPMLNPNQRLPAKNQQNQPYLGTKSLRLCHDVIIDLFVAVNKENMQNCKFYHRLYKLLFHDVLVFYGTRILICGTAKLYLFIRLSGRFDRTLFLQTK